MTAKYQELAKKIVEYVGTDENIISLHHCQTRLRFKLKDTSKADPKKISDLPDVVQVVDKGGMFQVVIGMQVGEVYEEVEKLITPKTDSGASTQGKEKKSAFDIAADFISSIFSPIVPALAGAGMVKALLALLMAFHWIDNTSNLYIILNLIGDATFSFMPVLLAYTTAKKLNSNPILGAVTAGILCHPNWTALVTAGEPVTLAGLPLYLVRYTGSVIPIVLVMLVQAPLEKFLNKIVPQAIRLVVVPMIELIVMGILGFSILGPLGDYGGHIFTFSFLSEKAGWLEAMLMGGLYSPLVIFGLHHGLAPLGTMQMSQMGYDGIFGPGVLCANIGQGMASLVSGLTSKNNRTRQIGISSGITGLMGTTEPAIYGINLPEKYPLFAGMIGGAAGGLYAGLTHTHRFATGSSGLPAVVMYIGDGSMQYFYNIIIALAIDIVVTAIAVVILQKVWAHQNKKVATPSAASQTPAPVKDPTRSTSRPGEFVNVCTGKRIDKSEIPDPTFSTGLMGETFGIIPETGLITAPFKGQVMMIAPTRHAIGLVSDDGREVLIHVGIDTVYMKGKGFEVLVENNQTFQTGQPLLRFDIEKIEKAGYSPIVNVILTNTAAYSEVTLDLDNPEQLILV